MRELRRQCPSTLRCPFGSPAGDQPPSSYSYDASAAIRLQAAIGQKASDDKSADFMTGKKSVTLTPMKTESLTKCHSVLTPLRTSPITCCRAGKAAPFSASKMHWRLGCCGWPVEFTF